MSKNMLIDSAHAEEIRIAVVDDGKLDKFDFETRSKVRVKGNVYLAKVIRVEPSLQAAFVDYGGNRHGFLSFSEIHYDYFQIPVNDRQELEAHLQNAIAAHVAETGQTAEELDQKEIAKLRYQFYRRYKIQEVIKKRQIMLVQVTKEERGNKGAALTTYISLAGRYCVLMPNTPKGSGVSRKITNRTDREKLKKIVSELHIDNGSTVIRTAGIGHTRAEIKKDFAFLVNVWNEIRETTLKSSAPCLIHEEAGIIKRSLRDMYSKEIESVVVEGEEGYKTAKKFMKKLMPSHSKKVKLYNDSNVPLFCKYKLNEQINQIYSTRVDLPSGGYLVINNTEALIAIDVNSGKSTRERNIAGTALKTNLEAAQEIARQCRLRDLAGLIVVDFIDMEEKRNNLQVERCMKESLKNDKAKIQVGSISNFGLLELSRQRLRSSIADANMIICPHCHGTGFSWSEESLAIQILRKIEEACISSDFKEIVVTLSSNIALYILNNKRSFISAIESRGNIKLAFRVDYHMASNDFRIDQITKPIRVISDDDEDSETDKKQFSKPTGRRPQKSKPRSFEDSNQQQGDVKPIMKKKNFRSRYRRNDSDVEQSEHSNVTVHKIVKPMGSRDRNRSNYEQHSRRRNSEYKQIELDIETIDTEVTEASVQESKKVQTKTPKIASNPETTETAIKSKKSAIRKNKASSTKSVEEDQNLKTNSKKDGGEGKVKVKDKANEKASEKSNEKAEETVVDQASTQNEESLVAKKSKKSTQKTTTKAKSRKAEETTAEKEDETKSVTTVAAKTAPKSKRKPKTNTQAKENPVTSDSSTSSDASTTSKSKSKTKTKAESTTKAFTKKTKASVAAKKPAKESTERKASKESVLTNDSGIPELKEGKIDFNSSLDISNYQRDIVSKVMQSYQENNLNIENVAPNLINKKKNGWWQKLLKKPETK